jgi:GNAT superfamily N-acetyltransferase
LCRPKHETFPSNFVDLFDTRRLTADVAARFFATSPPYPQRWRIRMARNKRSATTEAARDPQPTYRALTKRDWPKIDELFGSNGACGGCWCMWWRVARGGKLWAEAKGPRNRADFRQLVEEGKVHGILAFAGKRPIGWCAFGPRSSFPRTERVRALNRDWSEKTWSVNCFYIRREWRGQGVAKKLADEATKRAFEMGAGEVEGYPVVPTAPPAAIPAAFAWTGVPAIFESSGYSEIPKQAGHRRIFLKSSADSLRRFASARKTQSAARNPTKAN